MIIHDVIQGSEEWLNLRLGLPTASEFHRIVTPEGREGGQAEEYVNMLLAEKLSGAPVEAYEGRNAWMQRGKELEEQAAEHYEFITETETKRVGFVTDDARTMGASPDRLVGEDGLVQIKCFAGNTQIPYLLRDKLDKKYYPQLQGELWITGRKWNDFLAFHPLFSAPIIRVERDEEFIAKLERYMKRFLAELKQRAALLEERGYKCKL